VAEPNSLLAALYGVWRRRKPNIDIEADLMAGVVGEHRAAARLRHVANQKTIPANLSRIYGKPFDEANELRIGDPDSSDRCDGSKMIAGQQG
jgi:hypothetical protein